MSGLVRPSKKSVDVVMDDLISIKEEGMSSLKNASKFFRKTEANTNIPRKPVQPTMRTGWQQHLAK